MTGIQDLETLLRSMEPELVDGEFVFVSVPEPAPELPAVAMVQEPEGITYVVRRHEADTRGMEYDFVAAWITLRVHSALDAVGLTAAVSTALAQAGISCNVLAGRFHDHLLVPAHAAQHAIDTLRDLATMAG
jgi:uncharacterized protein